MLISRYDWFFANNELIFLILVIAFDRDDSFISDFSAKSKHFSFAIDLREESKHFFFFYQFFHRQQSILQHSHCFFQIVKNDRKLSNIRRNFDYFFRESRNFRVHFFLNCANSLLIRINSKNKNAIKVDESFLWKKKKKETTKVEKICRLLKSTNEESKRFRASDMTEFENSVTATELSKANERISKIKTILIIFFIEIIIFFLNWLLIFFFLRLILSKLWQKHI